MITPQHYLTHKDFDVYHVDGYWFVTDPHTGHRGGDFDVRELINILNIDIDLEAPSDQDVDVVLKAAIECGVVPYYTG